MRQSHSWTGTSHSTVHLLQFSLCHTLPYPVCHAHIMIHKPPHNFSSLSRVQDVFHQLKMKCHLFRNTQSRIYPRYSKNHISGTRMLTPTSSKEYGVNYFISLATLHKFTSCFSSDKQWRDEKVQTRNYYCPHCPNTGRNPVLLLWPLAELPPTLTTARLVALLYSQKLVSVKQRRNNWFLGTVCCNFASCATQQVVQAWGGHTSDQEKRVLQIFTLPPAHLTALHLCCVLKHIRGSCQAPQSSLKWQNLIL